jgi:hypothetical protein
VKPSPVEWRRIVHHDIGDLADERRNIEHVSERWHWLLHSLIELVGPTVVYDVGLRVLEYPPTWVDSHGEADVVESAVFDFLRSKYSGI